MRVALISADREKLPEPVVPLGVLYVMAQLPERHRCELWDLCFEPDPIARVQRGIDEFQPEVIGLGIRNLQSAIHSGTSENLAYYQRLIAAIRKQTRAPIVLGGGGFGVDAEHLMGHLSADYGIVGEGEQAFVQLLAALESGDEVTDVPSLLYFDRRRLRRTPAAATFPALDGLNPPDKRCAGPSYFQMHGVDSVQSKRGCPMECTYCTYPLLEGRTIRERDPVQVVAEMVSQKEAHPAIEHFFIVDSVFNLPPRHAKAICREMISQKLSVSWSCCANPPGFDRELAELMVEAGCSGIDVGSDSGVDRVLERLKKGFKKDKIEALHKHCVQTGLKDCHSFIVGTTGETLEDVTATLDFCENLDPFAAIMGIWVDDEEALNPKLAASRAGFRREVSDLVGARTQKHSRWLVPALGINFGEKLFDVLRRSGLRGPLWQHLNPDV